jgi:PAS domain S-box-containing protein
MARSTDQRPAGTTRQLLVARLRIILWLALGFGGTFSLIELVATPRSLPPPFYVKLLGTSLIGLALFVLRTRWAARHAWPLSVVIVVVAYLLTAASGMVSPSREYVTTTVLFVGGALTTAVILPWGMRLQAVTVGVGALALVAAVLWADGDLSNLLDDTGAAMALTFALSVLAAREVARYRIGHRRELQARRRAEATIRRLNARLERRVLERSADLAAANRRLAAEVAERRQAAEELRASQRLLADIVDHSTAIISLKDREGRYLLVNREFRRVFGLSAAGVIGATDTALFPVTMTEHLMAHDREVCAGVSPLSFEYRLPDDRVFVCVKFPLRDAGGAVYGVGSVATDITRVTQLQHELRQRQHELAHALRLHTLGEMTAALAHEINQPLGAITSYAQGGMQRLRTGTLAPAEISWVLAQIAQEGLRAGRIIRSVRELIKREAPAGGLVDINASAISAVQLAEVQARLYDATVRLDITPDLPQVRGDSIQLEQVVLNLVLNAIDAVTVVPPGSRVVTVATERDGGTVAVTVSDNGAGIEASMADKLFTPFCTTKPGGLGLGLAISRWIIEAHDGRLWLDTSSVAGAVFRFVIPAIVRDEPLTSTKGKQAA